jgi:hypothetical protein
MMPTLTVSLPPEAAERLAAAAKRLGLGRRHLARALLLLALAEDSQPDAPPAEPERQGGDA